MNIESKINGAISHDMINGSLIYQLLFMMITKLQDKISSLPNGNDIIFEIIDIWHMINSQNITMGSFQELPGILIRFLGVLPQVWSVLPNQERTALSDWLIHNIFLFSGFMSSRPSKGF